VFPFVRNERILGAVEPLLRTRDEVGAGIRVGWELLHLLQLSVRSLEDTATRVVAGQIAGLIALWTQLSTFEEALPHAFAWAGWGLITIAIWILALRVTPRRLSRFWRHLDDRSATRSDEPLEETEEATLIQELTLALREQRDHLQTGIRFSVALGMVGLALAVIGYIVDKGFYAP
jgi:hypothetical protein